VTAPVAIKPAPAIASADTPQGPLPSPGDQFDPKDIQKGSEADVSAIGDREIGARGAGNWYSTNWEIGVGGEYSQEVLKSSHMITDPVVTEYVNRIGQNIVKNSDAKVPFTIRVIDSDEINAFALPGGFFFVNSGLILAADEESELAGVMAHEISHVIAHHAAREMTRADYAQIGSIATMIFLPGWTGYGVYEASQIGIPLTFLEFSRTFEAEADYLGVQYMYKAGYDPQGMITMFEKLEALEKQKPGSLSKAFEDHPPTGDRIVSIENEIATILPPRPDYVETTSEFDDVKARLARIENKRKTDNGKGANTPTLRRTGGPSDPNSTSGSGTDQGSDRPTLHPRSD
jgi:predicted Zn-dependent protease